jgi:hypothetical protein
VRVVLPAHLRNLAGVHGEVLVRLSVPVLTQRAVLDAVAAVIVAGTEPFLVVGAMAGG